MIWYYVIMLILSFINLGIFFAIKTRATSSLFTGLFILMPVANIAYFLAASATTEEGYIYAQKIIYLGGIFIPLLLIVIIVNFLKYKNLKWIVIAFGTISTLFYALTLTIGINDWYYVSYSISQSLGVTVMNKVYGPLHFLYYVYMAIYMIVIIGFLVYGFKKKNVSYKSLIYLVGLFVLSMISSILGRFTGAMDTTPIVYVLSGIIMNILVIVIEKYNLSYMNMLSQDNELYYGMIALDYKKNYLGCSDKIYLILPEMKDAKIDVALPQGHIFDHINELIEEYDKGNHDNFINCKKDDVILKFAVTEYKYSKKKSGYIIDVSNDTKRAEYIDLINNYNETLANEIEEKTHHIKEIQDKVTLGMATMVETRDENTGGHVKRTSDIIVYILQSAKKLHVYKIDNAFFSYVKRSAPMHDLGKMSIPDEVLNKPGKFTPEEFEIMKTHTVKGEKMVGAILEGVEHERFVKIAKNVARYHHEKYGGGGYPDNLSGEDIPLEARLMALADVYDALVSKRVYKERMSFSKAAEIIYESMGSHFDPKLLPVFEDCRSKLEKYYEENNQ